jgi:hypothetical protein
MVVHIGVMSSSFSSFEEKSSSTSILLENNAAQHKGERGCRNKRKQNNCEEEYDHVSNCASCHVAHVVIEIHKMFVITIRKRLVPTKDTT